MERKTITVDINRLRRDMMDHYGTAMTSGFPMAVIDLSEVQLASNEKLVRMAVDAGIDISKYSVD